MSELDYSDLFPKTLAGLSNGVLRCGRHDVPLHCPSCEIRIPAPAGSGVVRCAECGAAAACQACVTASAYPIEKFGARWVCDGPEGRFHATTKAEAELLLDQALGYRSAESGPSAST